MWISHMLCAKMTFALVMCENCQVSQNSENNMSGYEKWEKNNENKEDEVGKTFKNSQYDDGSCQYDDEDDCGVGSLMWKERRV